MKKIFLFFIVSLYVSTFGQQTNSGRAKGLFFAISVGPRIPVSEFANSQALGFGIKADISYTDNEYIPLFFYGRIGWEHYPGSIDFYRHTIYSSITTNVIPIEVGIKLFFSPVAEDIVLLIPTVELGPSLAIYEKSHQFKIDSGRNDYLEETSKLGFHIGAGFSMFLIEIMGYYNYFPGNENLAADIKLRIPIFIKL
ncbi:MAG: hypothetical protein NTX22_14090 [Ignavibacteriales bacterium]|nr:hypothetical protein [Ignavibacteriales bacterium]